jgi:hypothetical protein
LVRGSGEQELVVFASVDSGMESVLRREFLSERMQGDERGFDFSAES